MTSQCLLQPLPASAATYPGVCLHSKGSLEITVIAMLTSLHEDVTLFLVHQGEGNKISIKSKDTYGGGGHGKM